MAVRPIDSAGVEPGPWLVSALVWLVALEGLFFLAFARPLEAPLAAFFVFGVIFSLPGALAYFVALLLLPRTWRRVSRRLAAVGLSPLVLALFWLLFYSWFPGYLFFLIGTTAYGLTVPLPGEPSALTRFRRGHPISVRRART